jgi:hypothetical protein
MYWHGISLTSVSPLAVVVVVVASTPTTGSLIIIGHA